MGPICLGGPLAPSGPAVGEAHLKLEKKLKLKKGKTLASTSFQPPLSAASFRSPLLPPPEPPPPDLRRRSWRRRLHPLLLGLLGTTPAVRRLMLLSSPLEHFPSTVGSLPLDTCSISLLFESRPLSFSLSEIQLTVIMAFDLQTFVPSICFFELSLDWKNRLC